MIPLAPAFCDDFVVRRAVANIINDKAGHGDIRHGEDALLVLLEVGEGGVPHGPGFNEAIDLGGWVG